jgi:hypothetical protein
VLERDRHRGREVEHVDSASSPHLAVDELAAEGVPAPSVGVDGHHVGVAHEEQPGRRRVAPLDPGEDARAAGVGLVAGDVAPGPLELAGQQVGVAGLVAGVGRAVVHAGVADERLQQLGDLAGDVHGASVGARRSEVLAPDARR